MDPHVEKHYEAARRFDEGEIYQSEEYMRLSRLRSERYDALLEILDPRFEELLAQLLECLDKELELECLHYFAEGYAAGKAKGV